MEPKVPTAHASLALIAVTPERLSLTTRALAPADRASTATTIEASAATCRLRPPAWRSSSNRGEHTTPRAAASIERREEPPLPACLTGPGALAHMGVES